MKKFAVIFLLGFLVGCEKDDTNENCSSDCTNISGRLVNANQQGIANVEVKFSYFYTAPHQYIRHIDKVRTDENGNYTLTGFVKDEELGGTFKIAIDIEDLDSALDDAFIKPSQITDEIVPRVNEYTFQIENRDDVISVPLYTVPKKALITVQLNGFMPIAEQDYFKVQPRILYGFGTHQFLTLPINQGWATGETTTIAVPGAVGVNWLKVQRNKNSVYQEELDEITISDPADSPTKVYQY